MKATATRSPRTFSPKIIIGLPSESLWRDRKANVVEFLGTAHEVTTERELACYRLGGRIVAQELADFLAKFERIA